MKKLKKRHITIIVSIISLVEVLVPVIVTSKSDDVSPVIIIIDFNA